MGGQREYGYVDSAISEGKRIGGLVIVLECMYILYMSMNICVKRAGLWLAGAAQEE